MSDAESIQKRFALAHYFPTMRFGDSCRITREDVQKAYPPTGDADHSIDGAIRALALAAGGNRPETSMTSLERVKYDLPDDCSFAVNEDPRDGSIIVRRALHACPRCHGTGVYREPIIPDRFLPIGGAEYVDTKRLVLRGPCDHKPLAA